MISRVRSAGQWAEMRLGVAVRNRRDVRLEVGAESRVWVHRFRQASGTEIVVGDHCLISARIVCEKSGAKVSVGNDTFIGGSLVSAANEVSIGSGVLISSGCVIMDHDSHSLAWEDRLNDTRDWAAGAKDWSNVTISRIEIGDHAWIGINAIVLQGITIGERSVVAAGSVVTRSVAPATLVAGNPARRVRDL